MPSELFWQNGLIILTKNNNAQLGSSKYSEQIDYDNWIFRCDYSGDIYGRIGLWVLSYNAVIASVERKISLSNYFKCAERMLNTRKTVLLFCRIIQGQIKLRVQPIDVGLSRYFSRESFEAFGTNVYLFIGSEVIKMK